LSKGNCYNANLLVSTVSTIQEQAQNQDNISLTTSTEGLVPEIQTNDHSETQQQMSYADEKMIQAFGATLINADSFDEDDKWVKRWEKWSV
jgi:hypothetical protein